MRPKSCSLVTVALWLCLVGCAEAQETDPVKAYARADYQRVVELLAPKYLARQANIQQRLILARAYLHLQRPDDALGVLKSVLATDRENPEANRLTGRVLHEKGKHAEALKFLKQAFRLKQDPATASLLGRCYHALGQPTKAKVHLEQALQQDVRDPTNSLLLGRICLARGLGALAEKYLLTAEEAGLASAELYGLLGQAYLRQRKYVGPVLVRRLSKPAQRGDVVEGQVVLAPLEGVAGRYKVCTRYCALYEGLRLLKASPDSADAQFMLTAGWLAAGDANLAARGLALLRRKEPHSHRAVDLQVRLLMAKADYAALDRALAEAVRTKVFKPPRASDLYCRAAAMLRAAGRRDQAVAMLGKAEKLSPTSGPILRSLARLHLASGRKDQARGYYARLVELFPDAADIDELRNTLRILGGEKGGAL